ncbi:MAG: hypothetical protein M5U26_26785 [Planctomycetota bacterium]|nr:hypothetical protein [Planctomycetota bacterium]
MKRAKSGTAAVVLALVALGPGLLAEDGPEQASAGGPAPSAATATGGAPPASSRRQDRTVTLLPGRLSFELPATWLKAFEGGAKNLRLTPDEIRAAREPKGEWDPQFDRVANAALPFDRCAFHGGAEGWGEAGSSNADVQMRAYVGTWELLDVENFVKSHGKWDANEVAKNPHAKKAKAVCKQSKSGDWQVDSIAFPLWFGDNGGTAMLDFYSRKEGEHTFVLVFMYTDKAKTEDLDALVASCRFTQPEAGQP